MIDSNNIGDKNYDPLQVRVLIASLGTRLVKRSDLGRISGDVVRINELEWLASQFLPCCVA
jgi:hypothetical protein